MDDFQGQLELLGWSQAELARRLGIHQNTITKWRNEPPKYAAEYLKVCVMAKRMADELQAHLARDGYRRRK